MTADPAFGASSGRADFDSPALALQHEVLPLLASDASLSIILEALMSAIERISGDGMLASILLMDEDGRHLRCCAAPSLPSAYNDAIDGVAIGLDVGSCGTAAYTRHEVAVSDIEHDPRWKDYAPLALEHGLRACWSTPIFSPAGEVLGTFANYYTTVRDPTPPDRALVETVIRFAVIAIEQERRRRGLRRQVERMARVSALTEVLSRATDLSEIFDDALGALADCLEADRVSLLLYDEHRDMKFAAARGLSIEYQQRIEEYSPAWREGQHPHVAFHPDLATDAEMADSRWLFEPEGIRAIGFVPLTTHHAFIGKLGFYYDEPHQLSGQDLDLAATIGRHVAMAIERRRGETESLGLQQQLDKERLRLREMFNISPAFIATMSGPDHVFVEANPNYIALVGHRDIIGKPLREALPEIEGQGYLELLDRVYTTREPYIGKESKIVIDRNGALEERYLDFVYQALTDSRGHVTGIFVNGTDVTEQVRARHALSDADRRKDEFIATLSHELRTPLTVILGWARMLKLGDLDEETVRSAVETIEKSAQLQAQLIDDVLDISRIVTGKLRITSSAVDLRDVGLAALDAIRLAATAKGISATAEIADDGPFVVLGDAGRLQQVIWNLLTNAIKFTPADGQVRLSIRAGNGSVRLSVSDTGIGIRHDFLQHVFEPFRQAEGSTTRTHGGLGLGLSIVCHLVEAHGGTVTAESLGEGAGATFTIELPRMGAAAAELIAAHEAQRAAASAAPSRRLDGLSLLVIDDQAAVRGMLVAALQQAGAEVQGAASVQQAIGEMHWPLPDAILCDIAMPDEDGYSFIRWLRSVPRTRKIPVIAVTALGRGEDRAQVLDAGFDAHVPKPVDPAELTALIARLHARG